MTVVQETNGVAQSFGAWSSGHGDMPYASQVGDISAQMPPWVQVGGGASAMAGATAEVRKQQHWLQTSQCTDFVDNGEHDDKDTYGDSPAESYCDWIVEYGSPASSSNPRKQSPGGPFKTSMRQWNWYVDNDKLEEIGADKTSALLESCMNQVRELSKSARYSRLVQHAFQLADEQGQARLVSELKTRVIEITMDAHSNHVLQRAIAVMRPGAVRFVLDELLQHSAGVCDLAKHRYGCRVLERIIEHFPPQDIADLVSSLLANARSLLGHPFGNFIMQHILEHGEKAQQRHLVATICRTSEDLLWVAKHQHACGVLDKALSYCPIEDQQCLARKALDISGLLPEMALQKGGFMATLRLFTVISDDPELLAKAKRQLTERSQEILSSKHGRPIIARICPELLEGQLVTPLPRTARLQRGRASLGVGRVFACDARGFDPGGRT